MNERSLEVSFNRGNLETVSLRSWKGSEKKDDRGLVISDFFHKHRERFSKLQAFGNKFSVFLIFS